MVEPFYFPSYGYHCPCALVLNVPPACLIFLCSSLSTILAIPYTLRGASVHVATTASVAAQLLSTTFHTVTHTPSGITVTRASDYTLPEAVQRAASAVFGLHGVPLPPRAAAISAPALGAATVTPAVLRTTYSVSNISVNRQGKNLQAVGEFQNQYMGKTDLTKFFQEEMPGSQPGDDQISKFVGAPYVAGGSVEADLDTQYMMGMAPGVKTQFWEIPNQDFCADLKNYTDTLLSYAASSEAPLVNSVSYGWQGALSGVGCATGEAEAVDLNLAKLAAAGITMIISSGDSGSGFTPTACNPLTPGIKGLDITQGTVMETTDASAYGCCVVSQQYEAAGFTFTPAHDTAESAAAPASVPLRLGDFANATFYTAESISRTFPTGDTYQLTGTLTSSGGRVLMHNDNGTIADTKIDFGPGAPGAQRTITASINLKGHIEHFTGYANFSAAGDATAIVWMNAFTKAPVALLSPGPRPPLPPGKGVCKIYSEVAKTGPAPPSTVSGGPAVDPAESDLFPSWPASSPWVTAVGATRFIDQKPGQGEMASDQFGSGGGFSNMFDQSNATWQQAAVAAYVKQGPSLDKFPPSGTFPAFGRATPDVSGLGEGYRVYVDGLPQPVGGTSASAPMFAGLISLINEQRLSKGQAPMGFLNPFLYKNADCFYDVTEGTNAISRQVSAQRRAERHQCWVTLCALQWIMPRDAKRMESTAEKPSTRMIPSPFHRAKEQGKRESDGNSEEETEGARAKERGKRERERRKEKE